MGVDRVMVVSGGAHGIGRAIVLQAAQAGYRVAFTGRSASDAMAQTVAMADAAVGEARVLGVVSDVRSETEVDDLFDDVLDRWDRIDVVVHNAAVNRDALLVHSDASAFDEVVGTNLTGAFLLARRGVTEFLGGGEGGRFIAVGSISAAGATSQVAYAASKAGLAGLTRTIAKEYGSRGITANIVAPGLIDTGLSHGLPPALHQLMIDRSPVRRSGSSDDVAGGVLFLASAEASYINGVTLNVTGGLQEIQW